MSISMPTGKNKSRLSASDLKVQAGVHWSDWCWNSQEAKVNRTNNFFISITLYDFYSRKVFRI